MIVPAIRAAACSEGWRFGDPSVRRVGPCWSITGQAPSQKVPLTPAHGPAIDESDRSGLGWRPPFVTLDGATARKARTALVACAVAPRHGRHAVQDGHSAGSRLLWGSRGVSPGFADSARGTSPAFRRGGWMAAGGQYERRDLAAVQPAATAQFRRSVWAWFSEHCPSSALSVRVRTGPSSKRLAMREPHIPSGSPLNAASA